MSGTNSWFEAGHAPTRDATTTFDHPANTLPVFAPMRRGFGWCSLGILLLTVGGLGGVATIGATVLARQDLGRPASPTLLIEKSLLSATLMVAGFVVIARATWSEPVDEDRIDGRIGEQHTVDSTGGIRAGD